MNSAAPSGRAHANEPGIDTELVLQERDAGDLRRQSRVTKSQYWCDLLLALCRPWYRSIDESRFDDGECLAVSIRKLLDGLRGLAALIVVLHHLGVHGDGHFAVMVFFVISVILHHGVGAVVSAQRSSGFGQFMARRIKRIYPPYLLAVVFFCATRIVKAALGGHNDLQYSALDWLQNLTLTQWVANVFHPISWPSANPHLFVAAFWSLNYEEQFYLVIAIGLALAAAKRIPLLVSVVLLAVIGLVWNWCIPGN